MTEEIQHGSTRAGAVIADIGGDRGALILYTPDAMAGMEIEISPLDSDERTHVAVLERRVGPVPFFAAFYPMLTAREYMVWRPDGAPLGALAIAGGVVTEAAVVTAADGGAMLAAHSRPPTVIP
jgi:hypothetical protein